MAVKLVDLLVYPFVEVYGASYHDAVHYCCPSDGNGRWCLLGDDALIAGCSCSAAAAATTCQDKAD